MVGVFKRAPVGEDGKQETVRGMAQNTSEGCYGIGGSSRDGSLRCRGKEDKVATSSRRLSLGTLHTHQPPPSFALPLSSSLSLTPTLSSSAPHTTKGCFSAQLSHKPCDGCDGHRGKSRRTCWSRREAGHREEEEAVTVESSLLLSLGATRGLQC